MIEDNFLRGPPINLEAPQESFGVIIYNHLKNHRRPDEIILIDSQDGEQISYSTLYKMSTTLAENLKKVGVQKGDTIAIISENSWKFLLSAISGFYLGAKMFLLNPDLTTEELEHLLSKCPPKITLCSEKSLNNILKLKEKVSFCCGEEIYCFGQFGDQVKKFEELLKRPENVVQCEFETTKLNPEEEVALILTSSGTTGLPKAVAITHKGIKSIYFYARDPQFLDLNENECTIAYLPMFHIFGMIIGLSSILCGTKNIIFAKFIPDRFLKIIQDFKITKLFAVPPILVFLVKSPLVENYDLSSIKDIIGGAAFIAKELEEMVMKRFNVGSIRQLYGMTELTGIVTIGPKDLNKSGSCGKATHNVIIKIRHLDSGKILKSLEVGEICVKCDGVMKGYCRNIEETKAAFDEDNFLKTGDLGYYDEDKFLFVVDRVKDIIKYKGFQVAPAELEAILIKHPAVKDVAVVGKPDERAGEVPVAFIATQPGSSVLSEELVKYVAENVSVQKRLYGGVRFVGDIPKNPSGKILRRKLKLMLQEDEFL